MAAAALRKERRLIVIVSLRAGCIDEGYAHFLGGRQAQGRDRDEMAARRSIFAKRPSCDESVAGPRLRRPRCETR
jgi:hypothetical protein